MKKIAIISILVMAVSLMLLAPVYMFAQCPGGQCPNRQNPNPYSHGGQYRQPANAPKHRVPSGKYASIVRIHVELGGHTDVLGSGVFLRWGGASVVVTARHVVTNAKNIFVTLTNGKKYSAKVLATSSWDCAVIQLDGEVNDVEPADLVTQAEADAIQEGTLESCGYGGQDTEFAINVGRFVGYRDSPQNEGEVSDWIVIAGPSRQGDSGGPIYNANGHVIGILWGTDGQVTIGVHAGRIGIVLNESLRNYK